jgi:putative SOS response-associated peptidase YedK
MCGRYVSPEVAAMEREYHLGRNGSGKLFGDLDSYSPSFNLAPSQAVPVIRVVRDVEGRREATLMRWGLVPHWSKGEIPKYHTFNCDIAKLETAATWRGPWRRGQRCVMPAVGYYEWHVLADGSKLPYFIRPVTDDTTFAIAALWDESSNAAGESLFSAALITMPANELLAKIHNTKMRMPAILLPDDIEAWLSGSPAEAKAVLKQFPSQEMVAWPVSRMVNSARNQGPELIVPTDIGPNAVAI